MLFALGACDSAYTGPIGSDPVDTYAFGAVTNVPSAARSFAGVTAADATIVQDTNGTCDAYLAIAGVLPGTDFGIAPTTGSAVLTGSYQVVQVTGPTRPRTLTPRPRTATKARFPHSFVLPQAPCQARRMTARWSCLRTHMLALPAALPRTRHSTARQAHLTGWSARTVPSPSWTGRTQHHYLQADSPSRNKRAMHFVIVL